MNIFKKNSAILYFFLGFKIISFSQNNVENDRFKYAVNVDCPTELVITPLDECGDYLFTLGEGQVGEDVYWYFDDGSYLDHVSYTETHHYASHGTYAGYAQYTSDVCSTTTYNFLVMVPNCFSTVSTEDNFEITKFFFSNPVQDRLIFNTGDNKIEVFKIYNFLGEIMPTPKPIIGDNSIDVSFYAKGIYILFYQIQGEYRTQQLVVE